MAIDIAFSINRTLQVPLMVDIFSILSISEPRPGEEPLLFNVVVPVGEQAFFEDAIRQAFGEKVGSETALFRVKEFLPPDYMKRYLDTKFQEKEPQRKISSYMQYARQFIKDIFTDMGRIL